MIDDTSQMRTGDESVKVLGESKIKKEKEKKERKIKVSTAS